MDRLKIHLPKIGRKKAPADPPEGQQGKAVATPSAKSKFRFRPSRQAKIASSSSGKATVNLPATDNADDVQDGNVPPPTIPAEDESMDTDVQKEEKLTPILELWDEVFDKLCDEKKTLMTAYKEQLSKVSKRASTENNATVLRQEANRREQAKIIIDQRTKEVEEGRWKIPFGDHPLVVADLVQKVVGIIDCKLILFIHL